MRSMADRFRARPTGFHDDTMRIREGRAADYHALAEFHYRDAAPATMMRVWTMHQRCCGAAARFAGRRTDGAAVAVLVESLPALGARMRDEALGGRYRQMRDLRLRAAMLNREVCCISRVVVHPQYRGLGLAVRLVRHALRHARTPYVEAFAAMGHVNPFFERAGMTAYPRPRHAHDQRLIDALARLGMQPIDLALPSQVQARLAAEPPEVRRWCLDELHRWYRAARRRSLTDVEDVSVMLVAARKRLFCPPVYYLYGPTLPCAEPADA